MSGQISVKRTLLNASAVLAFVLLIGAAMGWRVHVRADGLSGFSLIIQNAGSPIGGAVTLNCSTGTSCSISGGVVTLTGTGGGITQLTGNGTAGPGSGSQVLTLTQVTQSNAYQGTTTNNPASGAFDDLIFDTNLFDVGGVHSTTVNNTQFTVPSGQGGTYSIVCQVQWTSNAVGYRQLGIVQNGSTLLAVTKAGAVASTSQPQQTAAIAQLAAGDYIQCQIAQSSGGSLATLSSQGATFGALVKVSN